jgi:hypothetical protein
MAQRGSDKHSPRVDDQMKHEAESLLRGAGVESHSREDLLQEPAAEGERLPNAAERPDVPDSPGLGIPQTEVEQRAEVARHLAGVHFPSRREILVAAAEEDNAPAYIIQGLKAIDEGRSYENVQDVWVAMGGHTEQHHS